MVQGTVQSYDSSRGFGSIHPDDGGQDVFVHQGALGSASYEGLTPGQRVDFDLVMGPNGPRAKSVRPASA
jgi:cold shock CspA family protein